MNELTIYLIIGSSMIVSIIALIGIIYLSIGMLIDAYKNKQYKLLAIFTIPYCLVYFSAIVVIHDIINKI